MIGTQGWAESIDIPHAPQDPRDQQAHGSQRCGRTACWTRRRSGESGLNQLGRMLGLSFAVISTAALKELAIAIPAATHNTI
jgi:hypothetical protein